MGKKWILKIKIKINLTGQTRNMNYTHSSISFLHTQHSALLRTEASQVERAT